MITFTFFVLIDALNYSIKYKVVPQHCISCGLCIESNICPTKAIHFIKGKAVIDQSLCIGCKKCEIGSIYNREGKVVNYKGCPGNAFTSYKIILIPKPVSKNTTAVKINNPQNTNTDKAIVKENKQSIVAKSIREYFIVNANACIGCQLCVTPCPVQAISIVNGKAVIDKDKCTACGICVNGDTKNFNGCPVSAISKHSN